MQNASEIAPPIICVLVVSAFVHERTSYTDGFSFLNRWNYVIVDKPEISEIKFVTYIL